MPVTAAIVETAQFWFCFLCSLGLSLLICHCPQNLYICLVPLSLYSIVVEFNCMYGGVPSSQSLF